MINIQGIGIAEFEKFIEGFPHVAEKAAQLAINQTADRAVRTTLKKEMLRQVAFPTGYLTKQRLGIKRHATSHRLEAIVAGRDRPTSLARFVVGGESSLRARKKGNIRVRVKPGTQKPMRKAFGVRLRNGNMGLAVRAPKGIYNSYTDGVKLDKDVYLLYGPSVDQVMSDVALKTMPDTGRFLQNEFMRQLKRLNK